MAVDQNTKIIFGLKVKQLRKQYNLSFQELKDLSGLSVSYLNEIEKGKKYPRQNKIDALAEALRTTSEELVSRQLSKNLMPLADLLDSNFLQEIPLDLFGIEAAKVVEIIANAPTKAFLKSLARPSANKDKIVLVRNVGDALKPRRAYIFPLHCWHQE